MRMVQNRRHTTLDRFIPERSIADFELDENITTPENCAYDLQYDERFHYINTARERLVQNNYRSILRNAIFLNKSKFWDISWNERVEGNSEKFISHWPVESRNKPLLPKSPSVFLDLPDMDINICKNIVDWGKTGFIATIFDSKVHLWNPDKKLSIKVSTEFYDNTVETCIKWNKHGHLFAMAVNGNEVAVYDILGNKGSSNIGKCTCSVKGTIFDKQCTIISAEWSSSNFLLTGCSNGTLSQFDSSLKWFKCRYRIHEDDIIKITLSCQENYVATVGIDKNFLIMTYPGLQCLYKTSCSVATKAIAWHPWRNSLLVLSELDYFCLVNVQSGKTSTSLLFPNSFVDSLIFNPMSAELLVSQHIYSEECNEGITYLRVMKNFNTVVDEVRCNPFRIPYLLWNPTGTKLGTASTEENFCIWDFFGRGTKEEKKHRNTKRKVYTTNISKNASCFGSTLR